MSAAPLEIARHKLTVTDYHRMAEAGILAADARVELIEGEIIDMSPIGTQHCSVVDKLTQLIVIAAQQSAIVRVQGSIRLSNWTEPEPDLAVLKARADYYRDKHPGPADVLLVIEVADSSLNYDRAIKMPLYAKYGVPEMWLFDLQNSRITMGRAPREGQYNNIVTTDAPGAVSLAAMPDLRSDLSQVLA